MTWTTSRLWFSASTLLMPSNWRAPETWSKLSCENQPNGSTMWGVVDDDDDDMLMLVVVRSSLKCPKNGRGSCESTNSGLIEPSTSCTPIPMPTLFPGLSKDPKWYGGKAAQCNSWTSTFNYSWLIECISFISSLSTVFLCFDSFMANRNNSTYTRNPAALHTRRYHIAQGSNHWLAGDIHRLHIPAAKPSPVLSYSSCGKTLPYIFFLYLTTSQHISTLQREIPRLRLHSLRGISVHVILRNDLT